jgi:hypothetical protein
VRALTEQRLWPDGLFGWDLIKAIDSKSEFWTKLGAPSKVGNPAPDPEQNNRDELPQLDPANMAESDPAEELTPPDGQPRKAHRKKERKTQVDVKLFVEAIFESKDAEAVEWLLTTSVDDLASRIKCDRKTVLNSSWWKEDRKGQAERFMGSRIVPRPRKSDF